MKIPIVISILFCCFALDGGAQSSFLPLYWEEVITLARLKSPSLRTGEEDVEYARLGYLQSSSNFLPSVSGSAGVSRSSSSSEGESSRDSYSYGLSGQLSLFSGFGDLNRRRVKRLDYESAQVDYRRTASDTYYNLRRSFLELLWAQENIELSREILSRRKENLDLVRLKYEAGLEDLGSLLRMEADHHQAQRDYDQSIRQADVYGRRLAQDIGLDESRPLAVAGKLEMDQPEIAEELEPEIETLIETVPELLAALFQVEKARRETRLADSNFSPELSLSSGISRSGDGWEPDWNTEQESWRLGLQLSVPIFSGGGRDFVNARMVRIRERTAEENLRRVRHRLGTEIHSAWIDLINAWDNLDVRRKYLEASAEQSRIITTQYLNGLVTYLEWSRVENDYISAQRSMLNAHRDVALALARWLRTLGRVEEERLLPPAIITGNP